MDKLVLLAEGATEEGGFPSEGWGIGALIILLLLLILVFTFGKGRPHA